MAWFVCHPDVPLPKKDPTIHHSTKISLVSADASLFFMTPLTEKQADEPFYIINILNKIEHHGG